MKAWRAPRRIIATSRNVADVFTAAAGGMRRSAGWRRRLVENRFIAAVCSVVMSGLQAGAYGGWVTGGADRMAALSGRGVRTSMKAP